MWLVNAALQLSTKGHCLQNSGHYYLLYVSLMCMDLALVKHETLAYQYH